MNNVNYRTLKSCIIKSCVKEKDGLSDFHVDYDKLAARVKDLNIVPVATGLNANRIKPENIAFLSEYFEKTGLSWFTEGKHMTVLTFVDTECIDEKCQKLMDNIATNQMDDLNDDKVHDIAQITAEYRCYFAVIVSYISNDPKRAGRPSYEIKCRANKVIIKSSDYQYNPKDFS